MSSLPERRHYVAVFLVSLCLLMLEIAVARILTVALFSHYAFVAVSLAMFGLGLSGLVVYLFSSRFPVEKVDQQLTTLASLFGLTSALGLLAFLHIHVVQELSSSGYASLTLAYTVLAIPFFLGGLCISLAMTHFSKRIAGIYFADLVGASVGCLGVVFALEAAPAPIVVLVVSVLVTLGASAVAVSRRVGGRLSHAATAVTALLLVAGVTTDLYTMRYIKTWDMIYRQTELWNAFSRVSAFQASGNAASILPLKNPATFYQNGPYPPSRMLDIDGAAWTPMMGWDGTVESIQFLRESVLYAVHHMRPNAQTLVIGTGGGRDLLAGLAFGQPSILGLEINPLMEEMVQDVYGDYTGRPYTAPGVEVIIDEARSRLTSLDRKFDIIQLSLIDTFSLNASGGFVFSENYLYTTEGFEEYYDHLTDDGILSLARYYVADYPLEILRLVAMTRDAWENKRDDDFSQHVVVMLQGVNATMMVKKSPFTDAEVAQSKAVAAELNAKILYVPGMDAGSLDLQTLVTTADWRSYVDSYPFYIFPPTDDRPFFFNFLRGLVKIEKHDPFRFLQTWNDALVLMYMLMGVVSVIAALFFLTPLVFFARQGTHRVRAVVAAPLLFYFACLGYGFLMLEIPLLQRFVLFLGYPVYALAVVLFALLLFSGIGSLIAGSFTGPPRTAIYRVLSGIIVLSLVYVVGVPLLIVDYLGAAIAVRIGITVALLAPIGMLLGMAYPLGIAVLREHGEELVPWAWGLNGVMSVVASVVAVFVGSRIGFTAAFLTGVAAYGLAFASMALAARLHHSR